MCLTHVVPYPPRAGNTTRIHRLLRWLAAEGWDVLLVVCPFDDPDPGEREQLAAAYPNVVVAQRDATVWHRAGDGVDLLEPLRGRAGDGVDALLGGGQSRGATLARTFCPDPFARIVWHLDRVWRPDVVLAEYAFMARAFPLVRPGVRKVVDTIDVFSTKADKVERHGIADQYSISAAEEAELLRHADVVVGIQPDETALLCALAPGALAVTAGVDLPVQRHAPADAPRVLLIGDDNPMNVQGLTAFLHEAWPRVRAVVPAAELRVVGAVGRAAPPGMPGVHAVGTVDALEPEYAACRVAINPAPAGTGLKIKSVEALANLRPLVAWPAGVDGIAPAGRTLARVATDWTHFADLVVAALGDSAPADDAVVVESIASICSAPTVYGPLAVALGPTAPRPDTFTRRRSGHRRRVLTLLARHGGERYADAPARLRRMFLRGLPGVQHDMVLIDTALAPGPHTPAGEPVDELIGGSNEAWEFSAWDAGLVHVGDRLGDYDHVNLATSAFGQMPARHLDRLDEAALRLVDGTDAVIGHVDRHLEPVAAFGFAAHSWVRSAFVLVPPTALAGIGSLVSVPDPAGLFSGDHRAPFRADAPISIRYQEYIRGWLTGAGTGQGTTWHSRFDLTAATLSRFEDKARAIVNEQMLTLRLRAGGCTVVDATWLAGRVAELGDAPLGPIPPWSVQLAARDTDAVADLGRG